MRTTKFDCVIVGGGLAGGLLLHALKSCQPQMRVLLLERQKHLSSHQTWCFHTTDVPAGATWLKDLISRQWSRQKVAFPDYERFIDREYNAIRASDFAAYLSQNYEDSIRLEASVRSFTDTEVVLADGSILTCEQVIDARGWQNSRTTLQGYQKFVGWDVTLHKPHGMDYALLKDARVPQSDGYRFFYVLPWSERSLLVEDTYYSNSPEIDSQRIGQEIEKYIAAQGWELQSIDRRESGSLPLPFFKSERSAQAGLALGACSQIFHPVTGYTFPMAVARVNLIARLPVSEWKRVLREQERRMRPKESFLLFLNRMLFLAAEPASRYKVLQRFYRLPVDVIQRFYQGDLKATDWLRILLGKPPVPVGKALAQLFARSRRGE
ncbi:MAG: lycopene beta-cyclase CrtY [Bacillota bacterium]